MDFHLSVNEVRCLDSHSRGNVIRYMDSRLSICSIGHLKEKNIVGLLRLTRPTYFKDTPETSRFPHMPQIYDSGESNRYSHYRTCSCCLPHQSTRSALPKGDFGAQYWVYTSPANASSRHYWKSRHNFGAGVDCYSFLLKGLGFIASPSISCQF
jgi:hypothetical protein